MKKILFVLLAAALFGTASVQAITQEEAEQECKAQAADDGVSAEEMQDYIQECVDSLMSGNN
jgi:hypothetical protein